MPSIITASEPITSFPNLYLSPYGNDGVIPLYSSIPLADNYTTGDALPCVLCGNSSVRQKVVAQESVGVQQYTQNQVTISVV